MRGQQLKLSLAVDRLAIANLIRPAVNNLLTKIGYQVGINIVRIDMSRPDGYQKMQ